MNNKLQFEAYEKPTIEVVKFSLEEGIAASSTSGQGVIWMEEDDY